LTRFFRKHREEDLEEEIQAHLAMAQREHLERGATPPDAAAAARREFGNRTRVQEVTREVWGWTAIERFWQDLRYALRGMRRSPGFAAAAVLSLALGIGANTAIFSLVDTLLLRPLPVAQPQQLVEFLTHYPGDPPGNAFSWQSYERFRNHNHVFSGITGESSSRFTVQGDGLEPESVDGEYVIGNYFQMLGVKPAIGRLITPEDDRLGQAPVAVVSWSWWQSRFDLDPAIAGKRMVLGGLPVTIIGVAPRSFFGLRVGAQPSIWAPLQVKWTADPQSRSSIGGLRLVARLKAHVSIERARAEMAVLFRWTLEERIRASRDPVMRQLKFTVEPAGAGLFTELRDQYANPLLALMAVVVLLLLAACTNVASLLLARGAARRREVALRVALGAGRFRLLRQFLTEAILLSAAGALPGILLAYLGDRALVRIIQSGRPIIGLPPHLDIPIHPDLRVLLFTAAVALLTGVLFTVAPAWNALAAAPVSWLRDAGRSGETRIRRLFGKSLVTAQVALSVALLSAAAIFIGSLSRLEHRDLGFRRDHVLLMTLDPAHSGYSASQLSRAYQNLLPRLEAIPGVHSVTISAPTPLSGAGASRFVTVEGYAEKPEDRRYVAVGWIAPKYFETLGMPLLAGRDFRAGDQGGPPVAIINQAMARYYFGRSNPIGGYLSFDGDRRRYEIVGVAGNANYYEVREPRWRTIYLDAFQEPRPPSAFMLRTDIDPEAVAPVARRIVREMLEAVPVARITTLARQVDASIVPERLIAALSGLFGALGALLAAVGLYGLLAYTVTRRTGEIGIRMALGASRASVMRLVLRDVLAMVCAGLAAGMPLAFWAKHLAGNLIVNLPAGGTVPILWGAAAMVAVALIAAYLPARRAARVDPMDALHYE
jgi:putative ABC transport system permease protein